MKKKSPCVSPAIMPFSIATSSISTVSSPSISTFRIFVYYLLPLYSIICLFLFSTKYFKVVFVCIVLSVSAFFLNCFFIPIFMQKNMLAGLWGYDLAKVEATRHSRKKIPESLGVVCGLIYVTVCIFCQLLFSHDPTKLLEYNAGLLSICFMTFLGFADDVLDLPWRYKMILPFFASLPLLVAYSGGTAVLLPNILQDIIGLPIINLGFFYHFYMSFLTVFCTNSINIYAGLNGLEVGQSLVMATCIVFHNLLEIYLNIGDSGIRTVADVICDQHFLSILLSIPFFSTVAALLSFNWYPSKIFVGDTFTFFAGIYFAVVGILGHFSETLIFFFIPQIFNFLISIPQLSGIIHCPKHRVPVCNKATGKLESSGNYTILNLTLMILGPQREDVLVKILLAFQALCCLFSLIVTHFFKAVYHVK